MRYALESVKGVAEVASIGGYVREYQIDLNPNKLAAYGIPLTDIVSKIRMSNNDVGGQLFEISSAEYYVRGRGYIHSAADLEGIPIRTVNGVPVYLRDVASVHLGPGLRRGLAELDGRGETAGGVVIMRSGENALSVIADIKRKLQEIAPSLPPGVKIVPTYDRSALIERAIATLREKLIEESLAIALDCLLFLGHVRSALVAISTLPVAVVLSFLSMHALGVSSNIMSLGGIAIALGTMVDATIIMVENAHRQFDQFRENHGRDPGRAEHVELVIAAARSVGRPHTPPLGHHGGELYPRLRAFGPGRAPFSAAGLHQNFRHGICRRAWRHAGAGAHGPARTRPDQKGKRQSREPRSDVDLSPVGARGVALSLAGASRRRPAARLDGIAIAKVGHGIHATAQRRRSAFHALGRARNVDRRGQARPADPGPSLA